MRAKKDFLKGITHRRRAKRNTQFSTKYFPWKHWKTRPFQLFMDCEKLPYSVGLKSL